MSEPFLNAGIDEKKRFEILFDGLKEAYKELVDTSFRLTTVLTAVLAWFMSSQNPLGMLCMLPALKYFALAFTAAGWLMLVYLYRLLYRRADQVYQILLTERYDPVLFARYRVTRSMYLFSVFGHFTMLLGVFCLILTRYVLQEVATCG